MKDTKARYDKAVKALAEHGIPMVMDRSTRTPGDSFTEAVRCHGEVFAVTSSCNAGWRGDELHAREGHQTWVESTLYISYPHQWPWIGREVVKAFRANGFKVAWNGSPRRAVEVTL